MYCYMPPAPPASKIRATTTNTYKDFLGGKATMKEITIAFGPPAAPKINLILFIPNNQKSAVPTILGLNFCGNHTLLDDPRIALPKGWMTKSCPGVKENRASDEGRGKGIDSSWGIEQAIDRGYAVASFYHGDIAPDRPDFTEGVFPHYLKPGQKQPGPHDWGTIAAWAWGVQRAVDYLITDKAIDRNRIAAFGHSRNGKAVILASGFDERIALVFPHQAGCGGTSPSRGKIGESVKAINDRFPHWFNDTFPLFNDNPGRLPFDQHELIALMAPRPVLLTCAVEDTWSNPAGQFEMLQAADKVYRFLHAGGLEIAQMPEPGKLVDSKLGYFIRPGKHSTTPDDWKVLLDFADKHLKSVPLQNTSAAEPPLEWVEPETGHRVVRLSREPGSASLYFHQNPYTESGDKFVITSSRGISTIELKTGKIELIVEGRTSNLVVGRKTRQVFYLKDGTVYATHLYTRATRESVKKPELRSGSGFAVNADETLLVGSFVEGGQQTNFQPPASATPGQRPDSYPGKGEMMERRLAARLPMALYTINIKTGEVKNFYHATDWLNHVQFSPSDPGLMMFCHEGPWHKVDRIWTIRTDGSGLRKIHTRTMEMEIAGHEFFGADGRTIWFDLQTPKGKEFWLAGVVLATGEKIRYKLTRKQWSVHFNVSPDGKLFAGDGGGPNSVAAPGNGQWIYLFTPKNGSLTAEKLVNLESHDYRLEPNVTFTRDVKWIVFRSNMHGPTHVYAVEVTASTRAPAGHP